MKPTGSHGFCWRRKASSAIHLEHTAFPYLHKIFPFSGKLGGDSIRCGLTLCLALVRAIPFAPADAVTSAVAPNHRHDFCFARRFSGRMRAANSKSRKNTPL